MGLSSSGNSGVCGHHLQIIIYKGNSHVISYLEGNAGDPRSPGEFIGFLLTLADQLCGRLSGSADLVTLNRLRREIEGQLERVSWRFSFPVRDKMGTVSDELGLDRPRFVLLLPREDRVALLAHP